MRIDLIRDKVRFFFFIVVFASAGTFSFFAGKVWLAEYLDSTSKPELWQKAARWEPGNASYWEHLGQYERLNILSADPERAAVYLERAASLNPLSDRVWLELATTYEALGDVTRAKQAYVRAKAAHPISSEVASRYGRFLLRRGELQPGFAEIRRALVTDPSLTPGAVAECWKADPDVDRILNGALPAKPDFYNAAINFLLEEQQYEPAMAVWKRLLSLPQPVTLDEAVPLVNALIEQNRASDAERTWSQALEALNQEKKSNGALVFNGGFENQPVGGGFDWREKRISGVTYTLDPSVFHLGLQSMRVEFDGSENFDFKNLIHYVPVKPGKTYYFSAYLRTEDITTESGMRFWIYDPFHPDKVQALTANMTGTNSWTFVSADVKASAGTNFLLIALRRIPSWKFDNKLRGTVWIDDVILTQTQPATRSSLP